MDITQCSMEVQVTKCFHNQRYVCVYICVHVCVYVYVYVYVYVCVYVYVYVYMYVSQGKILKTVLGIYVGKTHESQPTFTL